MEAAGIPWGIVTNKPEIYSLKLLDKLDLLSRCGVLICPDHVSERKPHPEPIFIACDRLSRSTERTVYLGDHIRDIQAAKNADVIAVAAAYGYLSAEAKVEEWPADFILRSSEQALPLLNTLNSPDRSQKGPLYVRVSPFFPASGRQKILITGASDGIGRVNAICFAEHGAELLLLGRNQEKLEQLFDEIEEKSPGKVTIHPMDFAKARAEDYLGLADSLDEHFPVIDGLIHNAAQLGTLCPVEYYPDNDWETLINVNLNAVFHLTKAAMPSLKRSEDARLLFISSSVGRKAALTGVATGSPSSRWKVSCKHWLMN